MKKLFTFVLITLFLVFASVAIALEVTPDDPDLTFEWEMLEADLPLLKGFKLYWADTETGTYTTVKDTAGADIFIAYVEGTACTPADPCTTDQPFVVSGTPGSRFKKYFKMTAIDTSDGESDFSNVAVDEDGVKEVWFVNPMGVPFGVKVKIVRTP